MLADALSDLISGQRQTAQALFDELPVAIGQFDLDGHLVSHNQELARLMGSELPLDAADLDLRSREGGPLDGSAPSPIDRALKGEEVRAEEFELTRPDGSGRWVRLWARPTTGRAGGPAGAFLVLVDVGEARRLDALREQVLGVVAHDLRNPMSAMRMTLAMLGRQTEMPTERRTGLAERMLGTLGRMEGLVSTLIDHARSESGIELHLQRTPTDLGTIFERVKRDLDVLFPTRPIEVEQRGDLSGLLDAPRIERVLGNLLSNALKHGRDDAPVRMLLDGSDPQRLRMVVHNEGPALSADFLPHVFEPFTIGSRDRSGRLRSIGLGLFIVKHLVDAHGGSVSVRSTEQEGTTFTVILPREVADAAPSVRLGAAGGH